MYMHACVPPSSVPGVSCLTTRTSGSILTLVVTEPNDSARIHLVSTPRISLSLSLTPLGLSSKAYHRATPPREYIPPPPSPFLLHISSSVSSPFVVARAEGHPVHGCGRAGLEERSRGSRAPAGAEGAGGRRAAEGLGVGRRHGAGRGGDARHDRQVRTLGWRFRVRVWMKKDLLLSMGRWIDEGVTQVLEKGGVQPAIRDLRGWETVGGRERLRERCKCKLQKYIQTRGYLHDGKLSFFWWGWADGRGGWVVGETSPYPPHLLRSALAAPRAVVLLRQSTTAVSRFFVLPCLFCLSQASVGGGRAGQGHGRRGDGGGDPQGKQPGHQVAGVLWRWCWVVLVVALLGCENEIIHAFQQFVAYVCLYVCTLTGGFEEVKAVAGLCLLGMSQAGHYLVILRRR